MARLDAEWVRDQTNCPLLSDVEAHRAEVFALEQGLPFHGEHWKNWDNMLATAHCLDKCGRGERVLDAGACRDPKSPSAFLPGLGRRGFTRRHGINLDEPGYSVHDGAVYENCDITKTHFIDGEFAFVACLSVIEHGVDEFAFLKEMGRIIHPGGHLFVSFDYWHDPIDTGGRTAFGAPVRIFDRLDVHKMVNYANARDLILSERASRVIPRVLCGDKVVKWLGLEYTFMNLLFRKVETPTSDYRHGNEVLGAP